MDKSLGDGRIAIGSAGQIVTGNTQEELFIQGKSFSWEDRITFAADETKVIVFDQSLYTGGNLTIAPVVAGASSGPILLDFYTHPTYDKDGTVLQASNRREGHPPPKTVLRLDPSNLTLGTFFAADTIFASGLGVGNVNPGANLPGLPFESVLDKALAITNSDGAGTIVQFKITWFEV